jgi:NTE family protein
MSEWWKNARQWMDEAAPGSQRPKLGLALGGGFAHGIAHVGVLRAFARAGIPIDYVSGVSAGSIVAASFASGSSIEEIEVVALKMRFSDVARWRAGAAPMRKFLSRLLKVFDFEKMRIPLAVVATDLTAGAPAVFRERGDVVMPIQASCSYPGMFQPVRHMDHCLVDGSIAMDVPAGPLRRMGATHVVSVVLPNAAESVDPGNMLSVVTRCFQVMTARTESQWRRHSNLVIVPDVRESGWSSFANARALIEAGERAAQAAIPQITRWLKTEAAA